MKLNLLEKTEIWIKKVEMKDVDLNIVARRVAEALNLRPEEVLVVDVRESVITIDILKRDVEAEDIIGKKEVLFQLLKNIPGLTLTEETAIHSEGILGMIEIDKEMAHDVLRGSEKVGEEIRRNIRKRVIVFSTGFEIRNGMVRDTNLPYIVERLSKEGYNVTAGKVLEDDEENIGWVLQNALSQGFGTIITTGGVGAEGKDKTIEGLLKVDPHASTPYVTKYAKGTGRHEKDGVRIGVGRAGESTLIALPGPNDEVKLSLEMVIDGIKENWDKTVFADRIAALLRDRLLNKFQATHEMMPK